MLYNHNQISNLLVITRVTIYHNTCVVDCDQAIMQAGEIGKPRASEVLQCSGVKKQNQTAIVDYKGFTIVNEEFTCIKF